MINSVFNMTIDGRAENSPDQIDVINPATEAVVATIPDCSRAQLDAAVADDSCFQLLDIVLPLGVMARTVSRVVVGF